MPTAAAFERRLRQRSALAEFALRAMGAVDTVSVAEAAADAAADGLGAPHAAVFERKSYGLDLLASAGWPTAAGGPAEPPTTALAALDATAPVAFAGAGETAHGLAARADRPTDRLLVAAGPDPVAPDADDAAFFADVAAVLRGAFARVATERALRESEARARTSEAHAHAVLDTTVDGILTIDDRGRVQSFNPAAERIFGYRAAEVVGQNVSVLMPEPYRGHHDGYVRAYLETGRRRIIGIGREVVGRRRDGSTFPMDLAVSEVVVPGLRLFTGIVRDITARRALERQVVDATEAERRRLGHELHDELGQELSGIGLLTRDLARRLEGRPELAATAAEIADLLAAADRKARTVARGLVQVDVGAEGLGAALRAMAGHAGRLFGLDVAFETAGEPVALPPATATHLYRVAQEAVTNAARHADAASVTVGLAWTPDEVRLTVVDDGVGIPEAIDGPTLSGAVRGGTTTPPRGLGLQAMAYRARLIGGALDLSPADGGGTAVACAVPLALAGLHAGGPALADAAGDGGPDDGEPDGAGLDDGGSGGGR